MVFLSFLCTFLPFVGVFGQYLTIIDEFWSFSLIAGEKLVTNCNLWAYIWIFWRFQPVSGELRPFQWSSGQIGSFWAVLGSFLAFSRTLHFYSLILTYKKMMCQQFILLQIEQK